MNQFLEIHKLTKLPKGEIDNFSKSRSILEIEPIIKTFPKKTSPGLKDFTSELHQTLKEEMIQILHNLFQRIKADHFPIHYTG